MSEYKTLKEWFGESTRGDGRKFTRVDWLENQWVEPIYLDRHKDWHCLDYEGYSRAWGSVNYPFKEWHPPKKTKKIVLYKPVFKTIKNSFYCPSDANWHSDKDYYKNNFYDIKGWISQEVEVDDGK